MLCAAEASAGTFDVKGTEVTKGEHELAFGAAWEDGFPVDADPIRQSYEIGYGYGLTDWWKVGIKLAFEQPLSEDLDASSGGVETQFLLINPENSPFGLAWFTGLDFGIQDGDGETLTFGPLLSFGSDALSVTLNPLFEKTYSPSEPGIAFSYAWQIATRISDTISLGIEGYGSIPDIADAPSVEFQEHRLGPVVYFHRQLASFLNTASMKDGNAEGPEMELQLGLLFGLTDATADVAGKLKLAVTW
jgi:hypothetical protein